MRIHRFLSLTDLVVGVVVLVALFLPRRPLYALDAYKLEPEARADLGAAEARWMLHPESALAAQAFSRQLVEAGQIDWAVEVPRDTAAVAAPDERWRAWPLSITPVTPWMVSDVSAMLVARMTLRMFEGARTRSC